MNLKMRYQFKKIGKHLIVVLISIISFLGHSQDNIQSIATKDNPKTDCEKIATAEWSIKELSTGVKWKYFHFDDLFSSKQSVTIIEINNSIKDVDVDVSYVEKGFLKTSEAGVDKQAIAAVNGSFFDVTNGGSVTFFKKDGKVLTTTHSGFTSFRENAGFTINSLGECSIIHKPASGWESVAEKTVLVSGPLLMNQEEVVSQVTNRFNKNRHPRTAIGITKDGSLINVVVDGRSSEAYGVSIKELTVLMKALGCVSAMNLDGGGSSTAWVKNFGVVNYPSDNKKFDHEGERGVATVLIFSTKE